MFFYCWEICNHTKKQKTNTQQTKYPHTTVWWDKKQIHLCTINWKRTTTNQAINNKWSEQLSGTQVECRQKYLGRSTAVEDSLTAAGENYFCGLNTHTFMYEYQLSMTNLHDTTCCIMANMLQTKVDAQCDKLATELSWQCLLAMVDVFELQRVIYWKLQILTYPTCSWHLCWGWPHLNFAEIFGNRKLETVLSCGIVCMILHLAISVEHWLVTDRQTDRYMTMAYNVLAWRHTAKIYTIQKIQLSN